MIKQQARKSGLSARRLIRADVKKVYDKIILDNLSSLNGFYEFNDYFVYLDYNGEVGTRDIVQELLRRGKSVYAPKIIDGKMYAVKYAPPFIKNAYGIDEPQTAEYADKIDVSLTPLAAADKRFNRVGYGKGYYDRFFADNPCLKIGLCYSVQFVDEIQNEKNDVPLDVLVTEKYILEKELY